MGEGAGVVVLEELRARQGARREDLRRGRSATACRATPTTSPRPSEDGDGAFRCMQAALKRAGIDAVRHRLRQRPRHLDAAGRRDRTGRGRAPARRCGVATSRCPRPSRRSAICSAPPARSRRSSRSWRSATRSRRRRSTSTIPRSRPAIDLVPHIAAQARDQRRPVQLLRLRRHQRLAGLPPASLSVISAIRAWRRGSAHPSFATIPIVRCTACRSTVRPGDTARASRSRAMTTP